MPPRITQRAGPPEPPFGAPETATREEISAYAARLDFQSEGGGRLALRAGGAVRIEPTMGMHQISSRELRNGRIIARLNSSDRLPGLGLGAGLSYVWVDARLGSWRGVIIPTVPQLPMTAVPAIVRNHAGPAQNWAAIRVLPNGAWWRIALWTMCYDCCICLDPTCREVFQHPISARILEIVDTTDVIPPGDGG